MARRDVVGGMRASCILASVAARSITNLLTPLSSFRRQTAGASHSKSASFPMEPLENRRLLASVSLSSGVLNVVGDTGSSNTVEVTRPNTSQFAVKVNGSTKTFSSSSVSEFRISGGNSKDNIRIDTGVGRKATIRGNGGDDWIKGGGGNNIIYGGDGNDSLYGNYKGDTLYGEAGNDLLDGGSGTDKGDGGSGTDKLVSIEGSADYSAPAAPLPTSGIAVSAIQLWDAGANKFIRNVNSGDTLDLATLPSKISFRAATSGSVESVKFGLDSNSNYKIESAAPYTISGDASNGAPHALNLSLGSHTVIATPYTSDSAKGSAGTSRSVSFKVTRGETDAPVASSISVTALELWNAGNNTKIKTLSSNDSLDLSSLPSGLTVVAQTSGTVGSVRFALDSNSSYRTESAKPFSISGDDDGDLANWSFPTGTHTIKGTPYTRSGASGTAGESRSVTLNITRSGGTPSAPPPTTEQPSTGGITPRNSSAAAPRAVISSVSSTSIHAGQSYHANAMSSSLNYGTPLTARYVWDFGDSGSKYNVMQGFNAAHYYSESGTYTVKLSVTNEAGKTHTTSTTVNVQSAGRKRIYVSTSGSDSNDGLSDSRPIKTWDKAISKLGDNVEILFKGGQTFDVKRSMNIHGNNVVVGSYGTGKAKLNYTGPRDWSYVFYLAGSGKGERTVEDLVIDSIYTGTNRTGLPLGVGVAGRGDTVRNNDFINLGYGITAQPGPDGMLVQGNSAPVKTGLRGYFAWAGGDDLTFLDNYVSNVDGHVIRIADVNRINITGNDFTNPNETSGYRGTLTIHKGQYAYVANNKLSQGKVTIGPLAANEGIYDKGARWRYGVFEGNVINSKLIVEHGAEHVIARNNVLKANGTWGFEVQGYNSEFGRGVVDATFANNTVINSEAGGNFIRVGGDAKGISLINNLYVAPSLTPTGSPGIPVFVYDTNLGSFDRITGNVWPSVPYDRYAEGGVNYVYSYWSNAQGFKTAAEWEAYGEVGKDYYQDVSFDHSSFAPSSSSIAASVGIVADGVFTDMRGKIRSNSGSWTAGAVEV